MSQPLCLMYLSFQNTHQDLQDHQVTATMEEDRKENKTDRDIEACDGGEEIPDSSLTPDESIMEPISEACECDESSGEYEKSSTLQMKDEKQDKSETAAMQLQEKTVNKYKYKKTSR